MSKIQFINAYDPEKHYSYDERLRLLRELKVEQTEEKAKRGGADEDDYGLIVYRTNSSSAWSPAIQTDPSTVTARGRATIAGFYPSIRCTATRWMLSWARDSCSWNG